MKNHAVRVDNDAFTTNQQASFSGKLSYDLGFATLISVTSYQDWKYNFSADVDGTNLAVNGTAANVTNPIAPGAGVSNSGPYHATSLTQEVRMASKGPGPLSCGGRVLCQFGHQPRFHPRPRTGAGRLAWLSGHAQPGRFCGRGLQAAHQDHHQRRGAREQRAYSGLFPEQAAQRHRLHLAHQPWHLRRGQRSVRGAPCGYGRHLEGLAEPEIAPRISAYGSVATGYKGYAFDISSGYTPRAP
jgi:iron complex outermembrane receptor protein